MVTLGGLRALISSSSIKLELSACILTWPAGIGGSGELGSFSV